MNGDDEASKIGPSGDGPHLDEPPTPVSMARRTFLLMGFVALAIGLIYWWLAAGADEPQNASAEQPVEPTDLPEVESVAGRGLLLGEQTGLSVVYSGPFGQVSVRI